MQKTIKLWMLLVIALSIASCADNSDNPVANTSLEEALTSTGLFSGIKENPDKEAMEKKKGNLDYLSQYSMFIEQPVNHNQPDADKFKQKVSILFRGFDRPTIMVTEGYIWSKFFDAEDIGINLKANMVHVEHRNFGESFNQDKGPPCRLSGPEAYLQGEVDELWHQQEWRDLNGLCLLLSRRYGFGRCLLFTFQLKS